jgi:amidase
MTWQDIAVEAQKLRDSSIAKVEPAIPDVPADLPLDVTVLPKELLSEAEIKITESAPDDLVSSLAAGQVSAVDVTNAFLRRAGLAQKLARCLPFDSSSAILIKCF